MPTAIQLQNEAQVLFAAGSHTVGTTLMVGAYYLLRNPEAKQRLEAEVRATWPVLDQPPSYEELEKLPFLASSFILLDAPSEPADSKNGTDRHHQRNVASRRTNARWPPTCCATTRRRNFWHKDSRWCPCFTRICLLSAIPDNSWQSVVSQSVVFVSFSEEIFSRPYEFIPDRWLQTDSKALDPWLMSFSKGPRSCLGIK
jgi:hypothetical protein